MKDSLKKALSYMVLNTGARVSDVLSEQDVSELIEFLRLDDPLEKMRNGQDWYHNNELASRVGMMAGWKNTPSGHQFYGMVLRVSAKLIEERKGTLQ